MCFHTRSNKKNKVNKYILKKATQQFFSVKKNEIPEGWNKTMLVAVNTLRSVGTKYNQNIDELQEITDNFPKTLARIGSGISKDKVKIYEDIIDNIQGEWYIPVEEFNNKNTKITQKTFKDIIFSQKPEIILYLHGGAMCLCSHKTHREMLLRLCKSSKRVIFAMNYRKPPEFPFPAPQEDCYNIYSWLIHSGSNITIAGDSAGANLALYTTKLARDNHIKLPKKLILISPWINLCENKNNVKLTSSLIENTDIDFLPIECIEKYAKQCIKDYELLDENIINEKLSKYSPCNFDLENFPNIYMFVGEKEMLIDQQRNFVKKVKESNVDISYIEEENMVHVYPLFAGLGIASSKRFFDAISEIF